MRAFGNVTLERRQAHDIHRPQAIDQAIDERRKLAQIGIAVGKRYRALAQTQLAGDFGVEQGRIDAETGIELGQVFGEEPHERFRVAHRPAGAQRQMRGRTVGAQRDQTRAPQAEFGGFELGAEFERQTFDDAREIFGRRNGLGEGEAGAHRGHGQVGIERLVDLAEGLTQTAQRLGPETRIEAAARIAGAHERCKIVDPPQAQPVEIAENIGR